MKKFLRISSALSVLALAVLLTAFSQKGASCAEEALFVCIHSLIPNLFPFMIISNMLVQTNAASYIGRLIPVSRIYGLPDRASAPIILGSLCGFPIGAAAAARMYREGSLEKTEAEVLISASANTGPSFVVFVIGSSFFGSISFGWMIYLLQLVSSVAAALTVNRLIFPFRPNKTKSKEAGLKLPDMFSAVTDSVRSMLTVCGFVVFFSVITGILIPFVASFSETLAKILTSIAEFTGGAKCASLTGGAEGRFLCGLSVGFSGLCVLCQTASFTAPLGLSMCRCFCTKVLQGILTALLALLLCNDTLPAKDYSDTMATTALSPLFLSVCTGVLCFFAIKNLFVKQKM